MACTHSMSLRRSLILCVSVAVYKRWVGEEPILYYRRLVHTAVMREVRQIGSSPSQKLTSLSFRCGRKEWLFTIITELGLSPLPTAERICEFRRVVATALTVVFCLVTCRGKKQRSVRVAGQGASCPAEVDAR